MNAQTTKSSPAGRYALRGVMETASGFELNKDGSFRFFFSYGALDRYGSGHWRREGDSVVLNSDAKPAQDFSMTGSAGNSDSITMEIKEANEFMLRHFFIRIKGEGREQEGMTDEGGRVAFAPQKVDTVEVVFEFCPEKRSVFDVSKTAHNHFSFSPKPSLTEVVFQNFKLAIKTKGLSGGHPLSQESSFRYEKER